MTFNDNIIAIRAMINARASIRNACARIIIDDCARAIMNQSINEDMIDLIDMIALINSFARELIAHDYDSRAINCDDIARAFDAINHFYFIDINAMIDHSMID